MWLENIHVTGKYSCDWESTLKTWALAICSKDFIFTPLTLITVYHHLISFRGSWFGFPVFFIEHGLLSISLQHSQRFNHFITNSIYRSLLPTIFLYQPFLWKPKQAEKSQLLFNPLKFNRVLLQGQSLRPREAQLSAVSLAQHGTIKHCCGSLSMLRSKGMYLDILIIKRVISSAVNSTVTTAKIGVVIYFLIQTHFLLSDVDTAQLCCWQSSTDQ